MKILTFDIGGTLIKSGLYSDGKIDFYTEHPYPAIGREGILEVLSNVFKSFDGSFDAVGISTAGLVDSKRGEIIFCSDAIPDYTGTKLKETAEKMCGKKAFIINDVNAAALGEGVFGAGVPYSDFICLTYGTSIGGAIVINGSVYEGRGGYAGEIGHIVTHINGKKCACGGRGCYCEYASATALVEKCRLFDESIENGRDIFEKIHDENIKNAVDDWIDEIILGLVTVCHIFDPPAIILGGGIMNEKYITDSVGEKLKNSVMEGYRNVNVLPALLGNKAGLMGAAAGALRSMK